ncbi:prolyl oligopeptidase family serine peptidase [Microbacterium sp. RU33B]|uniref:S9 family peptidase n=1 Tax=Microbacterium sp. RU33B TaxID=1907390 RepID=UPI00095A8CC3|nr:prolyl oligopeptidase family serine peptidase [Microbacterium sp. RU33B]SIT77554.1 Dipeptidyl aminopeptidase/acylaminoacyl peptidase [Microbacterium sp. RU33B]
MTDILPYGSWPSPLSAEAVSAASPRLDGARFVGDEIWWGETVAEEAGRGAVRRRGADGIVDVLPAPWSARSRVHEYGGGSWTATDDGALVFVEKTDQRVWMVREGDSPVALTPEGADVRFGGLSWQRGRLLAVRETHDGSAVPPRAIVEIGLDGTVTALVGGSDFVAHPALSPDGSRLAWIAWDHPDMAWDRSELRIGRLEGSVVRSWTTITGGTSSPLQPTWTSDGELVYSDDPTGRWNLYRASADSPETAEPVAPADADTGAPLWVLGDRWYRVLDDGRIVAVRTHGSDEFVLLDPETGSLSVLPVPVAAGAVIEDARGGSVLVSGAGSVSPGGLWRIDVDSGEVEAVRVGEVPGGEEWMPRPRAIEVDGPHGPVHAFAYPPTHPSVSGPDDELPPYVVFVHGGPTAHVGGAASARIAYLTSRGIGVLDVNYGGSSGYGRAYRERLRGQWGVVDVDDVAAAARGLAAAGVADPARLAIAGGSAGGWTVLCALTRTDLFGAGISRYGVADLTRLAEDTHDFEARYLDGLVGPLPDAADVYRERSPLSRLEAFRSPVLILQGADDQVVPPSQSEAVRDALAANGVPHSYVLYEGEGHGFRRKESVVDAIEKEYAFLGAVFGFATPGVGPLALD